MLKKIVAVVVALAGIIFPLLAPQGVMAITRDENSARPNQEVSNPALCGVAEDPDEGDFMSRMKAIINVVLGIAGLIAVFMMIYGGVVLATSQGDAAKVTKGKHTILYGVVGLVIALLAFAIVNFVLGKVF